MTRDRRQEQRIEALAPLFDPVRRSLYLYVARAGSDVGRDEAAKAVGVSRSLAAFHLDKLAEEGLLTVGYRRLSGRSGPGAGRPAKMYRPSDRDVGVSIPPRDYQLIGRLLLEADADAGSARAAARRAGEALGKNARVRAGGRGGRKRIGEALVDVLDERGFQPRSEANGTIRLGNCPFYALAAEYRDAVCGVNLALLSGVLEGLRAPHLRAFPVEPDAGCCVAIERR